MGLVQSGIGVAVLRGEPGLCEWRQWRRWWECGFVGELERLGFAWRRWRRVFGWRIVFGRWRILAVVGGEQRAGGFVGSGGIGSGGAERTGRWTRPVIELTNKGKIGGDAGAVGGELWAEAAFQQTVFGLDTDLSAVEAHGEADECAPWGIGEK